MIVKNPSEFYESYGGRARSMGSNKMMEGAMFSRLLNLYGQRLPEGFIAGKNFRIFHKKVRLMGREFIFPFDTDDFNAHYLALREGVVPVFNEKFTFLRGAKCKSTTSFGMT